MVNVTKPILSVSCLCEQGGETHSAKKSLLRFGDGHEPLTRRGGVYFGQAQTVNADENTTRDKSQERCERADGQKSHAYEPMDDQKSHAYELMDDQKIHAYELMKGQKIRAYELMDQKIHAYELMDQKLHACELTDQKNQAYELTNCKKSCGSEIHACQLTDQKNQAYKQRMRKSRADERVLVSECGKGVEFESCPTVKEIACVKMQT